MLKDDLDGVLAELWECFSQDAHESFKGLKKSLLALETEPASRPAIETAYRAVHMLKGNARVLELYRMEALLGHAEELVGLVRDCEVEVDSGIIDCFFALLDALRGWLPGVVASRSDLEAPWAAPLERRLKALVAAKRGGGMAPRAPSAVAVAPEEGLELPPDEAPALLRLFVEMVLGDWGRQHNAITALDPQDPGAVERVCATFDDWKFAAGRVGQREIEECVGRCLDRFKGGDKPQLDAALLELLERVDEVGRGPGVFADLSSDEDPAFAPDVEYVRVFLELAEEEMGSLAAGIQHPHLATQRLMLRQAVGRLLHAATLMGYGQLVGMLNTLGDQLDTASALERAPLEQAERALFGALVAVQEQTEELAGMEPASLAAVTNRYRLWHVRRVEQSAARLQELVVGLSNDGPGGGHLGVPEAVQICGSLREALLQGGDAGTATLVMGLMDVLERVAQQEMTLQPDVVELLRSLATTVTAVAGAAQDAAPAEFIAQAESVLQRYARGGGPLGEPLFDALPLGEEYRDISTPEVQGHLQDALAAGELFYQLRVDLERDHATAGRFVQWLQSDGVRPITNITVEDEGRSLFEFLVATTTPPDVVGAQLEALDPALRTVRLFRGPHRPGQPKAHPAPLDTFKVESRKIDYLIDLASEIALTTDGMSPGSTGEALDPVALAHSLQRLEALSADLKMLTGTLRQTPTSASAPRPVLTPLNPPREI